METGRGVTRMEVVFFESADALRAWLDEHHADAAELWLGFYKKQTAIAGISYSEALDLALAYGWIDGIRKRIDLGAYTIRFTPRKPGSIWSEVNIKRASELEQAGLMQPAGLKAFHGRDRAKTKLYSYETDTRALDEDYEALLRADGQAWDFFQAQPASYRKAASWWVMSAKKAETRQKRLAMLIENSRQRQRLVHLVSPGRKDAARVDLNRQSE